MSLTFEQAYDEVASLFKTAWDANTAILSGGDPYPIFYDLTYQDRLTNLTPFCRFMFLHTGGGQRTLGGRQTSDFQRLAIARVMIYSPNGNGLSTSYQLAKIASDAFEGQSTDGGAWFREVRVQEDGLDGQFDITSVFANCEYSEFK